MSNCNHREACPYCNIKLRTAERLAESRRINVVELEAENALQKSALQELAAENGKLLKMYLDAADLRI